MFIQATTMLAKTLQLKLCPRLDYCAIKTPVNLLG